MLHRLSRGEVANFANCRMNPASLESAQRLALIDIQDYYFRGLNDEGWSLILVPFINQNYYDRWLHAYVQRGYGDQV